MTKYKSCDKDHILMSFVTEQKYEAIQARRQGLGVRSCAYVGGVGVGGGGVRTNQLINR